MPLPLSPDGLPCVVSHATRTASGYLALVSTRGLIVAALLCGLAILVAFTVQVAIIPK